MREHLIITIGRQYGSGGQEIGELLAKKLGIPFYDKNLLTVAAQESDIAPQLFEEYDEQPSSSVIYQLFFNSMEKNTLPLNQKLFLAQFHAIKQCAAKGPCVFIGRCADYALQEDYRCFNVFIHAGLDYRAQRLSHKYNLSPDNAKNLAKKQDKLRANYYNFYTDRRWGLATNYDLCINSALFPPEEIARFLYDLVQKMGLQKESDLS